MSIEFDKQQSLWVEKYRPKKIADCILKTSTRTEFEAILKDGKIPNMLLFGSAGTGKTTAARALCNELGVDYMIVNASNERGLDVIREKINSFASTVSFSDNGKCFILDEADYLLPATQAALRNASEEFSRSCSFIMTANYPNRIIEPLHSRFVGVNFNADPKELEQMQANFFVRITQILDNEGVEYDELALITVIQKYFPDNRRILNVLQQYGRHGRIDEGILMGLDEVKIDSLVNAIRNRKFKDIAQWAAQNKDNDTSALYEQIYLALRSFVSKESIPDAILILNDYQRYDSVVASKELHLTAMCTELMTTVETI